MQSKPNRTCLVAAACIVIAAVAGTPPVALAQQIDCARSPTYMRKIPGGQELVFHPQCEPPALKINPAKKQPKMAPVSEPAPNPVPIAGAKPINVVHTPAAADAPAEAAAKPKALNGHKSYGNRVRVQGYNRVRRN